MLGEFFVVGSGLVGVTGAMGGWLNMEDGCVMPEVMKGFCLGS
jgi:hypothetical protein